MNPPKYTNPKVPEGISSGHDHPLVDVAKSSAVVIVLVAALIADWIVGNCAGTWRVA